MSLSTFMTDVTWLLLQSHDMMYLVASAVAFRLREFISSSSQVISMTFNQILFYKSDAQSTSVRDKVSKN